MKVAARAFVARINVNDIAVMGKNRVKTQERGRGGGVMEARKGFW